METDSDFLPERFLARAFGPCRLKKRAAHLLNLIDKKGQHHQMRKHGAQVLLAESVVML